MEHNAGPQQKLAEKVLLQCRTSLALRYPALNGAFAALRDVCRTKPTVATDGLNLFFEPQTLIAMFAESPRRVEHGYLHLLLHCLYLHILPPKQVNRELWDLACDIFVECVLARETAEALPADEAEKNDLLRDFDFSADSPEAIMKRLSELPEPRRAQLRESVFFDDHSLWGLEQAETVRQKWDQARTYAGQRKRTEQRRSDTGEGTQAQSAKLRFRAKSRCAYRSYLRKFAYPGEEIETDDESFDYIYYTLGLQTYGTMPLIEPLEYREVWRLRELVIAIDTSGSCSEAVIARFLGEMCAILTQRENFFREMNVRIFQCDAQIQDAAVIHSVKEWNRYIANLHIKGRGSTDFCPVFDEIEFLRGQGKMKKPCVLLYYTDGDGSYPDAPPDYETAFLIAGDSARPDMVPTWAKCFLL